MLPFGIPKQHNLSATWHGRHSPTRLMYLDDVGNICAVRTGDLSEGWSHFCPFLCRFKEVYNGIYIYISEGEPITQGSKPTPSSEVLAFRVCAVTQLVDESIPRGRKDQINTRILHSGPKAQYKGDIRIHDK